MRDELHRTLERQLRRLGLQPDSLPDDALWARFLGLVSTSYTDADNDRYTLERSIEISSGEMRALHDELSVQARRDPLTGLWNRGALIELLQMTLRGHSHGAGVVLLFVDLDGFKLVNDSLGHVGGDELLVRAAERIETVVRSGDIPARIGGDEFVVVCTQVESFEGAIATANRIVDALAVPFRVAGRVVSVGASIGVAGAGGGGMTAEDLLRHADLAMYHAKSGGRSRVSVFHADMQTAAEHRLLLEGELRRALERDELVLHYQPIYRLVDGRLIGFEALVRWDRPGFGLMPPDSFVPVAETSDVIGALGAWVVARACRDAAGWPDPTLRVGYNASGRELPREDMMAAVSAALHGSGLDPGRLVIELTESVLLSGDERVAANLDRLRHLGVQLALDDFGTGFSSLAHLRDLTVNALKIDRSFIAAVDVDATAAAIIGAVAELGRALDLRIVAEGVERPEQLVRLRQLGCDAAQGFLFGRPVPNDELAPYFTSGSTEPVQGTEKPAGLLRGVISRAQRGEAA